MPSHFKLTGGIKLIIYHAHLKVKPEQISAFKIAAREVVAGSQQEPGNIQYSLYQAAENSATFVMIEIWQDREAIAFHKETSHYLTFKQQLSEFLYEPHHVDAYEGEKLN